MVLWSDAEVSTLLGFITDIDAVKMLDGKRQRNEKVFAKLHEMMKDRGMDKSLQQIRCKYKKMKSIYLKEKTKCTKSGECFYDKRFLMP